MLAVLPALHREAVGRAGAQAACQLPGTAFLSDSGTSKKHLPSKTYMHPPGKGESVLGQRALIILNIKNIRFLKMKLWAFQKNGEKYYE